LREFSRLREVVGYEDRYKFLIHDRDSIFASHLDESIRALGVRVLKSAPCDRHDPPGMSGLADPTVRIPPALFLKSWIAHYNGARLHRALGPGVPDPPVITKAIPEPSSRHRRGDSYAVRAASVLGGLHHEYSRGAAFA
jgi:putative transposase